MTSDYKLTPEQTDELDRITQTEPYDRRLSELTELAEWVIQENDIPDSDVEAFAKEFGTREVVGASMGCMNLPMAFRHLAQFADYNPDFGAVSNGGDRELLKELTGGDSRLDHRVYFALQELYGREIARRLERDR